MKDRNNRQVHNPGPRDQDVSKYCKRLGVDVAEERKLLRLLGKHAPLHEIRSNLPPGQPRFR
ncbi:hypothetical protein QTA58_01675 [Neorhizobium sp. CSC1952]|uniref:Uncharacterized protein n=1 Tax=Xaviernesmea oryzae TaxID=464029 RepID=A0A1X7FE58_9HYPH|nr:MULTISPECIES: hypothetical protein [Rhizobium/Agrobacterium group]WJR67505.1 hypothetical protein QTA58_01675 [Rhizobium sp. CSC1952]SMF50338.1 hypothetical protein SAMN02982989_2744 [Xaviernesmea oryzae]